MIVQDDLSLADIASERRSRRQVHRASPERRPEHFRDSSAAPPRRAEGRPKQSFLKTAGGGDEL
jgi:hypothetical protein